MKRGQLTIDFLIALTVALFILTALYAVIEIQETTQNKVNIQAQLDQITQKTAALITTTQILEDKKFTITTKLSEVSFLTPQKSLTSEFPSININGNQITASINIEDKTYSSTANFYTGNTTIITYNNGLMVITNES